MTRSQDPLDGWRDDAPDWDPEPEPIEIFDTVIKTIPVRFYTDEPGGNEPDGLDENDNTIRFVDDGSKPPPPPRTAAFNPDQPRCPIGSGITAGRFSNNGLTNCNPVASQLNDDALVGRLFQLDAAIKKTTDPERRLELETEVLAAKWEQERRFQGGTPDQGDGVIDSPEEETAFTIDAMSTHGAPLSNADFKNWKIVGYADGGAGSHMMTGCDYCGTGIRHRVQIQHRETGETCILGTDCSEKVGFDQEQIREMYEMKRQAQAYTPEMVARRKAAQAREEARQQTQEVRKELRLEIPEPELPREVFPIDSLFDLEGNLVTTNRFSGQYGPAWRFREEGASQDTFVNAGPKRRSTMEKKGYYEGHVAVERKSGRNGPYTPRDADNNYEANVIAIMDNGTDPARQWNPYDGPDGMYQDAPWEDEIEAINAEAKEMWDEYDAIDWDALVEERLARAEEPTSYTDEPEPSRTAAFNPNQPRCPIGTGLTAGRFSNEQLVNCNPMAVQLNDAALAERIPQLEAAARRAGDPERQAELEKEVELARAEQVRRIDSPVIGGVDDDPTEETIVEPVTKETVIAELSAATGVPSQIVRDIVFDWAWSSTEGASAVVQALAGELAGGPATFQGPERLTDMSQSNGFTEPRRRVIAEIYSRTQAALKGVKGVEIFRGSSPPSNLVETFTKMSEADYAKGSTTVSTNNWEYNPLSSWAPDRSAAEVYTNRSGSGLSAIQTKVVPPSDIFSTFETGIGEPGEYVVLNAGGPVDVELRWDPSEERAQLIESLQSPARGLRPGAVAAFNPDQPRCPAGSGETSGEFSNNQFINCNPQTAQLSATGLDQREANINEILKGELTAARRKRMEEELRLVATERERRADPNQPEGDPAAGDPVGDSNSSDDAAGVEATPELVPLPPSFEILDYRRMNDRQLAEYAAQLEAAGVKPDDRGSELEFSLAMTQQLIETRNWKADWERRQEEFNSPEAVTKREQAAFAAIKDEVETVDIAGLSRVEYEDLTGRIWAMSSSKSSLDGDEVNDLFETLEQMVYAERESDPETGDLLWPIVDTWKTRAEAGEAIDMNLVETRLGGAAAREGRAMMMNESIPGLARLFGLDEDDDSGAADLMRDSMRQVLSDPKARPLMYVPDVALQSIIESDSFLPVAHPDVEAVLSNVTERDEIERNMGLVEEDPWYERPIYTTLNTKAQRADAAEGEQGAAHGFGNIAVTFKPEVMDRSSATWGDTGLDSGNMAARDAVYPVPVLVSKARGGELDDDEALGAIAAQTLYMGGISGNENPSSVGHAVERTSWLELQIWGGATLDDVEKIQISKSAEDQLTPGTVETLRARGIEVELLGYFGTDPGEFS